MGCHRTAGADMFRRFGFRRALFLLGLIEFCNPSLSRGDIRLERVASGLNAPTYVTQAHGDSSSLYIVQRNFQVLKYDLASHTSTTILDLSGSRSFFTGDAGAVGLAFSPDFATNHTFFLSSNSGPFNQLGTNYVEQYTITGNSATLARTILQYSSNTTSDNHTVDWIGFDPTAVGAARNDLYITTGDGG